MFQKAAAPQIVERSGSVTLMSGGESRRQQTAAMFVSAHFSIKASSCFTFQLGRLQLSTTPSNFSPDALPSGLATY